MKDLGFNEFGELTNSTEDEESIKKTNLYNTTEMVSV